MSSIGRPFVCRSFPPTDVDSPEARGEGRDARSPRRRRLAEGYGTRSVPTTLPGGAGFPASDQPSLAHRADRQRGLRRRKLSVFNRIIGDSGFKLEFAAFLDGCQGEIVSFAKNYFAVGFKLDYVNADGDISNYYPDFFVKVIRRLGPILPGVSGVA
ncbi:MAG TPA: hypothetical protein VMV69_18925 [Pirellulales bacterium]|nr:hypothetical protein [Pirellulales bacterium]